MNKLVKQQRKILKQMRHKVGTKIINDIIIERQPF